MNKPIYKLRDWIDKTKLPYYYLSLNPLAIDYLKENPNLISWTSLSLNINAAELLLDPKNRNKIDWCCLSRNENDEVVSFLLRPENRKNINWISLSRNENDKAVDFITKPENINNIHWYNFNENNNPKVIDFLIKPEYRHHIIIDKFFPKKEAAPFILKNIHLFNDNNNNHNDINHNDINHYYKYLYLNPNPILLNLFKENFEEIDWYYMCQNPLLMDIIKDMDEEKYMDKIDWSSISFNTDKRAIDFLFNYPSKIHWHLLCGNRSPHVIPYLLKNIDKIEYSIYLFKNPYAIPLFEDGNENGNNINRKYIHWSLITQNPSIFTLDYKKMSENFRDMEEEILKEVLKPKKVFRYLELYNYDIDDMFD
jgi:hypothetical protein